MPPKKQTPKPKDSKMPIRACGILNKVCKNKGSKTGQYTCGKIKAGDEISWVHNTNCRISTAIYELKRLKPVKTRAESDAREEDIYRIASALYPPFADDDE